MRVVLDTNQLVAALAKPPELATFLMAWESARFHVIASESVLLEYARVLEYSDVKAIIYPELRFAFNSHLRDDIQVIAIAEIPRLCRDPDDDKVIATAIYGLADYLLTEDRDLYDQPVLELLGDFGVRVLTTNEFMPILG